MERFLCVLGPWLTGDTDSGINQVGSSELSVLYGALEEGAWVCDGVCEGPAAGVDGS